MIYGHITKRNGHITNANGLIWIHMDDSYLYIQIAYFYKIDIKYTKYFCV